MALNTTLRRFVPSRIRETYGGLPRDVYVLFIARVVNSMGNFVFPFLTLLLTRRIGMTPAEAGSIMLMSALAFVPGSIVGGKLADSFGRKRIFVLSTIGAAALFVPCAFLGNSPLIAVFVIGADFCYGLGNPAINALIIDRTDPSRRQAAFSLIYLGHNMGFAVGPVMAGILFTHGTMLLFLGDAFTTVVSVILSIIFVQESRPDREAMERAGQINPHEKPESGSLFSVLAHRPFILIFMLLVTVLNFVYAQITFALPLQLTDLFATNGAVFYGTIMTTNAVVVIVLTTPVIALTRRFRPVVNLIIVGVLYTIGFGMIRFIHSLPLYFVSTVIWTIGEVIGATNINVYVANHTPASHRGRMNSIVPILTGAGMAVGPLLMGLFMEHHPVQSVWVLSGALAAAGTIAMTGLATVERYHRGRIESAEAALPAEGE